ncbi:hypothetical protein Psuf_006240 [Phytohabitans suffuscus]|uniref:Uncharacterized protein n=1 Tax=Phytohabitans suffuscus TaxID=624315 RepID=A0A6F8YBH8_9ACTN|nr:hypothetical protein [Phytohabitans suffuscus]BCB83311.1 hypothetical protein Psuf_006240 [Phytohabitans suffuscus]
MDPRSSFAVRSGLIEAGGDSVADITVEMFWYAGDSGRVAGSRSSSRIVSLIGYASAISGSA